MKTKIILSLFVALLFGVCHLSAQQQSLFYFYKGNPIPLNVNTQHFLVYADASKISKEVFEKEYQVKEWIEDGSCGILEAQVHICNGNYDSIINVLTSKEYVIDIEPVVGDSLLTSTSRLFYVKLYDAQDYSLLSSTAQSLGAEIRGEVDFCDNWYELRVNKSSLRNSIEVANQFWKTGYFAGIDPGFIIHFEPASATTCVSDSRFDEQWGMHAIKACSAWKITTGDTNVKIAVIDMGIDESHQEFDSAHVAFSYDMDTRSSPAHVYSREGHRNGTPPDPNPIISKFHGIHVGGIVFANHNRNSVAGVSPNTSMINISISFNGVDSLVSRLSSAINMAVDYGSLIINNSWSENPGGDSSILRTELMEDALDNAISNHRVVVFSAGNMGLDSVNYPSSYRDEILSIGAISKNLKLWLGSNYGKGLDIVAPGDSILSSHYSNGYIVFKGTSMAAPHVSGVAGLIFSINPNLTGQEVRDIIEQTAQKLPCYVFDSIAINGTRNDTVAYGLLDAHRAVLKAAYHKVYGDTALTLCDTSHHAYTVRAPHNANIDSVSFFWTCSDNLQMVSGQNTDSVWVKRINSGVAQLQCHIIHDGDTVTSALYIPVVSGRTVYDNVSLDNSISFPDTFVLSRVVTIDSLAGVDWQDKTVLCTPDCRIVVRPGGSMVLSHTTLTPACPNEMWQGIEVVGDRTQPQNPHKQGMLHIENGCIIEHALTAVRNWLATDGDFTTTGGVVHAYASSFRNNGKAIEFNTYDYSPQPGLMPDYTTLFSQCTFTVNDQNRFAANGTAFTEHVRLCGVKGVAFKGCSFSDSTTSPTPGRRGVFTDDAGFSLDTYCDMAYNGCECPESHATYTTFSGFTTAVEVNTTGNPYPVSVNEARFSNNGTGIRINGNNFATVTRNTFNLQSAPYAVSNIGLRLDNCTGYKVEANTFSKITYTPQQLNSIGIYVNNSGNAANLLHLNSFSNLNYGIRAAGNNGWTWSGLQFTCNDFSWCGRDFYVAQNATVAKYIGSVSVGADNEFHNTRSSSLYNAGSQQIVYRFSSETNHNPYNPVNITAITVNTANSCASTLCNSGWNPKLLLAGFQSGMNAYNAALADNTDMDGMGNADGAGVETQDFASLQQALSESYYTAVRALIADSLLDLAALEQWHTAAQPIADPYSLTETQFCEGYAETFAENADDAELANYAEFHAMKLALRNQNDNMDNQNNNHSSNLPNSPTTSPSVNWYALTPAQIAQLQTIAERNTGRASVMAKGVLCFFFDICYENDNLLADEDGDADAETRAKHTAIHTADDAALNVHPNPTADLLHIELSDTEIATVALYDLQGRLVYSPNSPNSPINLRNVPAGVYILRVTDAQNRQFHHKIIIK